MSQLLHSVVTTPIVKPPSLFDIPFIHLILLSCLILIIVISIKYILTKSTKANNDLVHAIDRQVEAQGHLVGVLNELVMQIYNMQNSADQRNVKYDKYFTEVTEEIKTIGLGYKELIEKISSNNTRESDGEEVYLVDKPEKDRDHT